MISPIKFAYIYVMAYERAGPVKVGRALNPKSRRSELQTGSHRHLRIYLAAQCGSVTMDRIERLAHQVLEKRRISGEWFDVPVEVATMAVWCALEAFQFGSQAILQLVARQIGLEDHIDISHLPSDYAAYLGEVPKTEEKIKAAQDRFDLLL